MQCELPGVRQFKDGVELPASCLNMPVTLNAVALTLGCNCMEICVSLYLNTDTSFFLRNATPEVEIKTCRGKSSLLVCMCILNRIQTKSLNIKCTQIGKRGKKRIEEEYLEGYL